MRTFTALTFSALLTFAALSSQATPQEERGNVTGPMAHEPYDQAIAPYVAKARATYPAAKKRFLAGLPRNYTFFVWTRLYQSLGKGKGARAEDVFIEPNAIKDGLVIGVIANSPIYVTNYRQGEAVKFPESRVMNWVIQRPDGTEEGNYVGQFLERWKKHH